MGLVVSDPAEAWDLEVVLVPAAALVLAVASGLAVVWGSAAVWDRAAEAGTSRTWDILPAALRCH